MLDGLNAGAQGSLNPALAMGMGRDLAPHGLRRLHDRFQLIIKKLLLQPGRRVGEHAAGRGDLDHVRAILDGLAHSAAAVIHPIAGIGTRKNSRQHWREAVSIPVTPGGSNRPARCPNAGAPNLPGSDRIPEREDRLVRPAHILNGREPGQKCALGEHRPVQRQIGFRIGQRVQAGCRRAFLQEMHMGINQPRQDVRIPQIDDLRPCRALKSIANLGNAALTKNERLVPHISFAGHKQRMTRMDINGLTLIRRLGSCQSGQAQRHR